MLGRRSGITVTAVLGLMLLAACTGNSAGSEVIESTDQLVAGLMADGYNTENLGSISQPFFEPLGQRIGLDGQEIQVFEFETEADAASSSEAISPDGGSVGTSMVTWISTPHFYRSGKLIVIYVGVDEDVIKALEGILGDQIAGG